MDIKRKSAARNRIIRRVVYSVIALAVVSGVTVWVSRLKPAAPSVDKATVWVDTVKRGEMLRQVRGLGTLVPEDTRWIPAPNEGRIERINMRPGAVVKPDTVLIEMSNPELEQSAFDAESQLKAAEADFAALRVRLENNRLDQEAASANVGASYTQAKLRADSDSQLAKDGLISDLNRKLSQVTAEELASRYEIEKKRMSIQDESIKAQLDAQKARIEQLRAVTELRKSQVSALKVKAGIEGVLQLVPVEVGQRVTASTNIARIADPKRLKAELRIAETQAKDVQIGQPTEIDTRNGVIKGRVTRIDPAVQNGTVTVDVAMDGELPQGARPDLSVDGTIELERLENIIYVGRPVHGQPNSTISLFKLDKVTKEAVRVQVKLGRTSVNTIEILEGLNPDDQVILSDMSAWDAYNRIQLN